MKSQENTLAHRTDPIFQLNVFDDGEGDIEISVTTPNDLDSQMPAPLGLLYGLAIMTLDELGTLQMAVEEIIGDRMISAGEAIQRLAILTMGGVANEQVA